MVNEIITEELKSKIEEILVKADELNNPEAAIFCGKELSEGLLKR